MRRTTTSAVLRACLLAGALFSASTTIGQSAATPVAINGAGSTFDAPFFDTAFRAYEATHSVSVTYQAVGSGTGIQQFSDGTVDFAASDVPMNGKELRAAESHGGAVEQIPIALGGVAVAYNLSGIKVGLRLTGAVLANIFLGRITNWDDPAIAALNPKLKLPNFGITVVHRADSSGTSYIFTDYLSRVSRAWKSQVGTAKLVNWPVGLMGQGNDGVASFVQIVPGSIGYLELTYTLKYHATSAALKNSSGKFVLPSQRSVAAAASTVTHISATHFSIVNAPGKRSYPIGGYSWMMVRQHGAKASALRALAHWLVTNGQRFAAQLDYVPLPAAIQSLANRQLEKVR